MAQSVYDFSVTHIDGKKTTLKEYAGKVMLVVNVASKCGLTPQYAALEKLYEKYQDKGLCVLGFPANEFGAQEPGSNEEISKFCQTSFGVKFDMFQKVVVKGEGIHPLYKFMTQIKPEAQGDANSEFQKKLASNGVKRVEKGDILWNFEKFIINRQGKVIARFEPDVTPDDAKLIRAIEMELAYA